MIYLKKTSTDWIKFKGGLHVKIEFELIHSQNLPNMLQEPLLWIGSFTIISFFRSRKLVIAALSTTYIHLLHFYTYPVDHTLPIPNLGYENNVMEAGGIDKW